MLIGGENNLLALVDLKDQKNVQIQHITFEQYGAVTSLVCDSQTQTCFAGLQSGQIATIDLISFEITNKIQSKESSVTALAITNGKEVVFAGYKNGIIKGFLKTDFIDWKFKGKMGDHVTTIMLSYDDKFLFAGSTNRIVRIFDWRSNNLPSKEQVVDCGIYSGRQYKQWDSCFFGTMFSRLYVVESIENLNSVSQDGKIDIGNPDEIIISIVNYDDRIITIASDGTFKIQNLSNIIQHTQSFAINEEGKEPKSHQTTPSESKTITGETSKEWEQKLQNPFLKASLDENKDVLVHRSKQEEELATLKEELAKTKKERDDQRLIIEKKLLEQPKQQEGWDSMQEKSKLEAENKLFQESNCKLLTKLQQSETEKEISKIFSHVLLPFSLLPQTLLKSVGIESELFLDKEQFAQIWKNKKRKRLDKGGSSKIYQSKQGNEDIAIKFSSNEIKDFKVMLNEAIMLQQCKQKNIIEVKKIFVEPKKQIYKEFKGKFLKFRLQIMLEFLPTRLFELIKSKNLGKNEAKKELCLQIIDGLEQLHSMAIVHGDLHAKNIMLDKNGVVKIIDLGNARKLKKNNLKEVKSELGHLFANNDDILPPEQWNPKPEISPKIDIWALGILFYQIFTDQVKFKGQKIGDKANQKSLLSNNPILNLSDEIIFLINSCTWANKDQRAKIDEVKMIVNHLKF